MNGASEVPTVPVVPTWPASVIGAKDEREARMSSPEAPWREVVVFVRAVCDGAKANAVEMVARKRKSFLWMKEECVVIVSETRCVLKWFNGVTCDNHTSTWYSRWQIRFSALVFLTW